jgi:hypothetical protein
MEKAMALLAAGIYWVIRWIISHPQSLRVNSGSRSLLLHPAPQLEGYGYAKNP